MPDKNFLWTTGRRKTSIARVRVNPGTGQIQVNRRPIDKYFLTEEHRNAALAPLAATKVQGKYDFFILCDGGGVAGQAGAVKLGVARALLELDPALEPKLREEGFLTRDPRMKERKKYGLRGARRGVQYSKR
ncbi:MAG: 30S ribosomal protein S9 [Planctomycetes bacterium]|nr:30S ribosomal protein S9 [Planctomycetota bacterium]